MTHSKRLSLNLFASIAGAILFSACGQAVADKAPQFNLPATHGNVALQQWQGEVVLVDFWASWCGPCRESFPWMNKMVEKYSDKGLKIVAINLDQEHEDATLFLKNNPALFEVAFDPEATTPEAWGVIGMPSSFVVGRDGSIIARHTGFQNENIADYESAIQKALAN